MSTILIVEDNRKNMKLARDVTDRCTVVPAARSAAALTGLTAGAVFFAPPSVLSR
jgi:hypothetical protein